MKIPVRVVLKVVPLSTVTEASMDRETTFGLLRMIGHPDYDPRKEEWFWNPGRNFKEVVVTRNNVAGDVLNKNQREFVFKTSHPLKVEASTLSDEVTVRIEGDRTVMAGQPAYFDVELKTDSPNPPKMLYDWKGVDRILKPDGGAGLIGSYAEDSTRATVTKEKSGSYEIVLDAVREDVNGKFEQLNVPALRLEVVAMEDLSLGLQLTGPQGAEVQTGHDAKLAAKWYTIPYSLQMEELLNSRSLYVAWYCEGALLNTGSDILLMAQDVGERVIDVLLFEEDDDGNETLLTQSVYRLMVVQDPDAEPYEPEEWEEDPVADAPEGTSGEEGDAPVDNPGSRSSENTEQRVPSVGEGGGEAWSARVA